MDDALDVFDLFMSDITRDAHQDGEKDGSAPYMTWTLRPCNCGIPSRCFWTKTLMPRRSAAEPLRRFRVNGS